MAALDKTWSGENYWFWARRVLRKLRHGIRRANISGAPVAALATRRRILLMEPQLADNIGMVARAMANFGLEELRLIAPRDGWPNEKARIAASGANYVIDDAQAFPDLEAAIGDLQLRCRHHGPPAAPEKASADSGGGRRRDARAHRPWRTMRHSFRPRAQRPRDERGRRRRRAHHDPGKFPVRFPQSWPRPSCYLATAGCATAGTQLWAASRITRRPLQSGLNLGSDRPAEEGGTVRLLRAYRGRTGPYGVLQSGGETPCGGAEFADDVYASERRQSRKSGAFVALLQRWQKAKATVARRPHEPPSCGQVLSRAMPASAAQPNEARCGRGSS